ncbi:MAG TPA: DegV family protein [Anaerolineales bacterium]|nr:DegV family protein [Anaerolineales bacterium]
MTAIITDTTSGLPAEIAQKYQIPVIPQIITFGEESYYEGIELSNAQFIKKLRVASQLPKTAAPPPELFVKEFERLVPTNQTIFCIHPSAEVSGTVRSATVAAQDFPGADIRVIDTRTIGSPLATLVQLAAEWAASGLDADTIEERLEQMIPFSRIYFMVSTLEFLAKGGRIGGAAALLGNLLQIKPILVFRDGKVDQFERERTYRRAFARLKELARQQLPGDGTGYLSIMHADVPEEAMILASDLRAELNISHIPIIDLPPAVVTHGGPGILAVAFFLPPPKSGGAI